MNSHYKNNLHEQLQKALAECDRLRKENLILRQQLDKITANIKPQPEIKQETTEDALNNQSPVNEKIALFRNYFRGRADVYAVCWTSQTGRSGYSPACAHEWDRTKCDKPKIKCGECPNRALIELTDEVIFNHLSGKAVIGIYPMLYV